MGFFSRFFGPPSRPQFAKKFMKMLKQVGDPRVPTFEAADFRIMFADEGGKPAGVANLGNLYAEYCLVGRRERPAWLKRTCLGLANTMDLPEEFADAAHDLLPSLKPRSFLEALRREPTTDKSKNLDMPHLPVSEHLVLCLAYDLPHSMRFVPQDQLDQWGVTIYEAMETAKKNLFEKGHSLASIGDKAYVFMGGDAYDATRLINTEFLQTLKLDGDVVALAMTRDSLLVAGADDDEGLAIMADLAEKTLEDPRPLCSIPVRLVDGEWETWSPAPDHPHYKRFHALAMQFLGGEYADQKQALDKLHETEGTDVFVATYSGITFEDGRDCSYAVWSKGVDTWLPRTDLIAFYDPDTETSELVKWDRAVAEMGDEMTPQEIYPERWAVSEFPTAEQLKRMVAAGT